MSHSGRNNSISQRSRRDARNAMRVAFEKHELTLYPEVDRCKICPKTGEYVSDLVQVGWEDWRAAWHAATQFERSFKPTNQNSNN